MMETKDKIKVSDLESFLKFLDFLQEGIIVIEPDGKIGYINKYAEDILGIEEPEGAHFSKVIKNDYLYSIISHKYERDNIREEKIIKEKKFLVKV